MLSLIVKVGQPWFSMKTKHLYDWLPHFRHCKKILHQSTTSGVRAIISPIDHVDKWGYPRSGSTSSWRHAEYDISDTWNYTSISWEINVCIHHGYFPVDGSGRANHLGHLQAHPSQCSRWRRGIVTSSSLSVSVSECCLYCSCITLPSTAVSRASYNSRATHRD